MKIDATWDPNKAIINERRHDGIRFVDAATVLADPLAITVFDAAHSDTEERWFTLGRTREGQLLAVSHTWRELEGEGSVESSGENDSNREPTVQVRIISARAATRRERTQYEEGSH